MTTTPTSQATEPSIQDFLDQGGAPTDARHWLEAAYDAPDPMARVGAALCGLLGTVVESQAEEQREAAVAAGEVVSAEEHAELRREYDELEALHDAKQAVIERALEAMRKSTSKLTIEVRGILEPVVAPPVDPIPGTEPGTGSEQAELPTE